MALEEKMDIGDQYLAYRKSGEEEALLREFMERTAPEPKPPVGIVAPAGRGQGKIESERGIVESTGVFARELVGRSIAGGAVSAIRSTINAIDDVAETLAEKFPAIDYGVVWDEKGLRFAGPEELKAARLREKEAGVTLADTVMGEIPEPTTAGGKVVKSISQFLTGMVTGGKVAKGLGATGQLAKPLVAGAVADFTAFEGDEKRLSDLIQQVPALQNPITEYLASDEDDSKLEGRFKNALEGLGLGVATDLIFKGVKAFKAKRRAAMELTEAAAKEPDALVRELDKLKPDDLLPIVTEKEIAERLGDPTGPIVQKVSKRVAKEATEELGSTLSTATARIQRAERMAGETMEEAIERIRKPSAQPPKADAEGIMINLARINTPDDVKSAMVELAKLDKSGIDAARGNRKMTFETMERLADDVGMTVDELVTKRGRLTVEETIAARRLWTATAEQVTELARKVADPGATPTDLVAFRKAMAVHYAVQAEVIAERTAQARALASWRIEAKGGRENARAIQQLLEQTGGVDLSVEMARKIMQLADNPSAVSAFIRKADRATTLEVLQEYFVTGLLTSPKTHVVNTVSNSITALWAIPERYMGAAISQAVGSADVTLREAHALAWGQMKGMRDGLRMFWKALKFGEPTSALKIETPRIPAISSERLGLTGTAGYMADLLGSVQRGGSRLLMATDEFFKAVAYRGEIHAQAYREAVSRGLYGEDAAKFIADAIENPPENIRLASAQFADVQTFTNELGQAGKAFQNWVAKTPGMRFVTPFVRTPVNIFKYAWHRTPLAPFAGHIKQELAAGGPRSDLAMAKVALGTGVMLTVADLVSEGMITGGGPADKEVKSARLRQKIPDYGIKIGDTWLKYNRLDPLASMVGMAADVAEILNHVDQEDGEKIVLAGALAFAKNLTNKTYLEGLSSLVETIEDPNRYGPQWVSNFAGSFIPLSGLTRNIATTLETERKETKTAVGDPDVDRLTDSLPDPVAEFTVRMINELKSRTPGFGKDLPPKRDLWGRPIDLTSNLGMAFDFLSPVAVSREEHDPIDQMILDNRIPVTMPQRIMDGVKLTNQEYSDYVEIAGRLAKERLDQLYDSGAFDKLSDGPEGMKSELIRSVIMKSRLEAHARMLADNEDLRNRMIERKIERVTKLQ